MGLLSQEAKDAFANRQANTGKGSSRYLKPSEISEEGTLITFLGDQDHTLRGYQAFLELKAEKKFVKVNTPNKLSRAELKERAEELGAREPSKDQSEFYAFTIWNYEAEAVQIFEFTQAGLITGICEFILDPEVEGNEKEFDMKLKRVKTGNDPRDVRYSALNASISRFRPILLTSLTTVAGLLPLISETSLQAQFLIPMATSIAFGVLFGTFFILFFYPSAILTWNDFFRIISCDCNCSSHIRSRISKFY